MVIKLDMGFDESNVPDFGSIDFFGDGSKDITLMSEDISKLNSVLNRAVCVGTYHAENFSIKNGCVAVVPDAQRFFIYEKSTDCWYELG